MPIFTHPDSVQSHSFNIRSCHLSTTTTYLIPTPTSDLHHHNEVQSCYRHCCCRVSGCSRPQPIAKLCCKLGQSPSSLGLLLSPWQKSCAQQGMGAASNCKGTDIKCICGDTAFISSITSCVKGACDSSDEQSISPKYPPERIQILIAIYKNRDHQVCRRSLQECRCWNPAKRYWLAHQIGRTLCKPPLLQHLPYPHLERRVLCYRSLCYRIPHFVFSPIWCRWKGWCSWVGIRGCCCCAFLVVGSFSILDRYIVFNGMGGAV